MIIKINGLIYENYNRIPTIVNKIHSYFILYMYKNYEMDITANNEYVIHSFEIEINEDEWQKQINDFINSLSENYPYVKLDIEGKYTFTRSTGNVEKFI